MPTHTELLQRAVELEAQAVDAFEAGDSGHGEELLAAAEQLRRDFKRARRRSTASEGPAAYDPGTMTDRDAVAQSLQEIDALSSPKTIASYARARFDKKLAPSSFSTIRRDDQRAWESPTTSRAAYVVPGLEGRFFTPARGMVGLSTWELWRRIVGPRSQRVELLRSALQVIDRTRWLEEGPDEQAADRMRQLVAALVSSVPGADGYAVDLEVAAAATRHEYDSLKGDDRAWREEAADRAQQQGLSASELTWGRKGKGLSAAKEA